MRNAVIGVLVGLATLVFLISNGPSQRTSQVPPDILVPAPEGQFSQPVAIAAAPAVTPVLLDALVAAAPTPEPVVVAPEDSAQYLVPSCVDLSDTKPWYDDPKHNRTGTLHPELKYTDKSPSTKTRCLRDGTYVDPKLGKFSIGRSLPPKKRS